MRLAMQICDVCDSPSRDRLKPDPSGSGDLLCGECFDEAKETEELERRDYEENTVDLDEPEEEPEPEPEDDSWQYEPDPDEDPR